MRTVHVNLPGRAYAIHIGTGPDTAAAARAGLAALVRGRRCCVLTDSQVAPLHARPLKALLEGAGATLTDPLVIPAGEASKTLETMASLWRAAVRLGLDRRCLAVALGGGVVGDLAGFFAACYMRGIEFIQVPTTLLAMVDSSVGGKTGVDLPEGKNLVGAFHQPRLVWCDLRTLATLPDREWRCGLAEIVKYGVILDAALFARLEQTTLPALQAEIPMLEAIIARCCELKAEVVLADEKEGGRRMLLNYGHTFGHAVEALGGFAELNHGEAVAIGMGMAADLAVLLGLAAPELPRRQDALLERLGLPVRPPPGRFQPEAILAAIGHDKKTVGGRPRLLLPRAIGQVEVVADADPARILQAIGGRCGQP
ncbi:MAG: 3-dehydroquinate synthase [Lentisphaeria bacterium]|jgi:3-dehydroquinate synthase